MRFLRRAVLVLVLLAGLVHIGGGWYAADLLKRDGLDVRPWPITMDLKITQVSPTSITLKDPDDPNIQARSSATFGLEWPGGYGEISGKPKISGDLVTRHWTPVQGAATVGTKTSIDQNTKFEATLNPGEQVVEFPSPLGTMDARFYQGSGTTWAVLVHGKGMAPPEMERMAAVMTRRHLPTLIINYRNDPGQPQDKSKEYGFGTTEWRDLAAALDYARGKGAQKFIIGANSMGGAITASYMRRTHDSDVLGLALDAPMLNFERTIEWGAEQRSIPSTITWVGERLATMRFGLDWSTMDYLSKPDWVTVPTVIVHGTKDLTVPLTTSRALAKRSDQVELIEFAGAGHCQSWNFNKAKYDAAIAGLVDRATN